MTRYTFKGLTDSNRLVETMVDQSKMDRGEALFIVNHNIERCVEVWEGEKLCGYFIIAEKDGIRSFHGYNLTKGRTRHALRMCFEFLREERGKLYSCHLQANKRVNRLLKLLGFKDKERTSNAIYMERQSVAVPV